MSMELMKTYEMTIIMKHRLWKKGSKPGWIVSKCLQPKIQHQNHKGKAWGGQSPVFSPMDLDSSILDSGLHSSTSKMRAVANTINGTSEIQEKSRQYIKLKYTFYLHDEDWCFPSLSRLSFSQALCKPSISSFTRPLITFSHLNSLFNPFLLTQTPITA